MKVIKTIAVDFEAQEDVQGIVTFPAVIEAMSPRDIDRKPEGERTWLWWKMWSTTKLRKDTVIQDPNGVEFRVANTQDWGQGGFYTSDIVEQPRGL